MTEKEDLDGDAVKEGLGMADFFPVRVAVAWGIPEKRRTLDMVFRAAELTELPRRLDPPRGVVDPFMAGVMTTDEAGELPGESMPLPVAGLSVVTMVEIESRMCWLRERLTSSSEASITRMLALSASMRDVMSESSRIVSPLTVRRSWTPFSMMVSTRSMAGT